jgi:hypothetical protein
MSWAGCYVLDLYCDNQGDPRHKFQEFPHQYTSEHGVECRKDAKLAGWIIRQDGSTLCPKCNPKSPRYIPPNPGKQIS